MAGGEDYKCILCLKLPAKRNDVNFLHNIQAELDDLPFSISSFANAKSPKCICKTCLCILNKKRGLKERLADIDKKMMMAYQTASSLQSSNSNTCTGLTPCEQMPTVCSTPLAASRQPVVLENIMSPIQSTVSDHQIDTGVSECQVAVEIDWPSKKRRKVLCKDLSSLGKMLCRGTFKQIARSAWRCKKLQKHFLEEVAKQVHRECSAMCSKGIDQRTKKRHESCLRKTDQTSITRFSFEDVDEELREKAPLFQLVLKAASLRPEDKKKRWIQSVGVAAAVCLKSRSRNMTAFQLILAIINKHSGFMAGMKRMQALCLMPSHTYFYKKLDEFGMDHDKEILKKVANEEKQKDHIQASKTSGSTTLDSKRPVKEVSVVNSSEASLRSSQSQLPQSEYARRKILDSFLQIQNDVCLLDCQPAQKSLIVFPNWKSDVIEPEPSITNECVEESDTNDGNADKDNIAGTLFPSDAGRKLVLDNVDVHQVTHNMTEDHQNPDVHYCSLMATENRVSGNHLSDAKPICALKDMENGKCCPSKMEHKQQHENYIQLVSRVITHELPCLDFLQDAVVSHIPHQYSSKMRQNTDTVSIS